MQVTQIIEVKKSTKNENKCVNEEPRTMTKKDKIVKSVFSQSYSFITKAGQEIPFLFVVVIVVREVG